MNIVDPNFSADENIKSLLSRYEKATGIKDQFKDLFEECYEVAFPQRRGFFSETIGERRDEKIFDETCVVGVQEFASRLQQGLVPNFARWADFQAGSETWLLAQEYLV